MPRTGAASDWCGGPHARGCDCGLACEYDLVGTGGREGTCVDPAEEVPPAGADEACGGLRGIACQDPLVCWRASQAALDSGWLGRCFPREGGTNGTCALGVPELSCAAPLSCALTSHRCVLATGELDSPCGDGLPVCAEGLRCNGAVCVAPRDQ